MKAKSLNEKDLNSGEIEFLKRYNISIDEVIDVTGMVRVGQKRAMEAKNARIAINGGRCSKGHRFKTRSNHCPMCEPKNLAFERRHSETAHVYVCASETGFIKIGYAEDPNDREGRLNREAYASRTNWRLIFSIKTENAGKVEFDAHSYLASYKTVETYIKEGRVINPYEVFICSKDQAIEAVKRAAQKL